MCLKNNIKKNILFTYRNGEGKKQRIKFSCEENNHNLYKSTHSNKLDIFSENRLLLGAGRDITALKIYNEFSHRWDHIHLRIQCSKTGFTIYIIKITLHFHAVHIFFKDLEIKHGFGENINSVLYLIINITYMVIM